MTDQHVSAFMLDAVALGAADACGGGVVMQSTPRDLAYSGVIGAGGIAGWLSLIVSLHKICRANRATGLFARNIP